MESQRYTSRMELNDPTHIRSVTWNLMADLDEWWLGTHVECMGNVRHPAFAGSFYTDKTEQLKSEVCGYLQQAKAIRQSSVPKALIVPHAGYIYSAPIAASAYKQLIPWKEQIKRVVLIGPTHRVPFAGLATPNSEFFQTPLGLIPIDTDGLDSIKDFPFVGVSDLAHANEHSLEVQLPFLQSVLSDFTLLPVVVGDSYPEQPQEVIQRLDDDHTLFVISSDLSHYLDYDSAVRIDQSTCDSILDLAGNQLSGDRACGYRGIQGLLLAAKNQHWKPQLIDLRNSGDTAGDKKQVVGYCAVAFH